PETARPPPPPPAPLPTLVDLEAWLTSLTARLSRAETALTRTSCLLYTPTRRLRRRAGRRASRRPAELPVPRPGGAGIQAARRSDTSPRPWRSATVGA
ncbi:hypothetical protein, partial [Streptomyces resistomycificus]|uniref:hypothetical protein n=1 Tax=Streptomyces resistomycificus TaxID=67356 RepID=UPI001ADF3723